MIVKVGEAYASENGTIKGERGNQNGRELGYRYVDSNTFTYVIRFKFETPRKLFLSRFKAIINSRLCGYSQYDRYALHEAIRGLNGDVKKYIKSNVKTNCDCSSLVMTCINTLKSRSNAYNCNVYGINTRNMIAYFKGLGKAKFNIYAAGDTTPKSGDILLKKGHTCVVM